MRTEPLGRKLAFPGRELLSTYHFIGLCTVGAALILGYATVRSNLALALVFATALVFCPSVSLVAAVLSANLRTGLPALASGLTLPDVFLGLFVLGWVREALVSRPMRIPPRWTAWLIAFLGWAWLSLFIVHADTNVPALARVTLYGVAFLGATQRRTSRQVLLLFLGFGILEAVLGLAGVTPRIGSRLLGSVGDPAQFGLLMLFTMSAVPLIKLKSARPVLYAVAGLAVVSTYTRAVWVGGVIEAVLLVAPRVTRRVLSAIVVVSAVFVLAVALQGVATQRLSLNPSSLDYRRQSWTEGIRLVEERPFFGYGWASSATAPNPFNLWINVAASTGIIGAVFLAAFFFSMARSLIRSRGDPISFVGLCFLAGVMAVSLGEMTIYAAAPATITLFVVMGLVVGARMRESSHALDPLRRRNPMPADAAGGFHARAPAVRDPFDGGA